MTINLTDTEREAVADAIHGEIERLRGAELDRGQFDAIIQPGIDLLEHLLRKFEED